MTTEESCYFQNDVLFTIDTQDPVAVLQVEIPFLTRKKFVDVRFESRNLSFSSDRCFENVDHFVANVDNRSLRFSNEAAIPNLKPSSIFSSRVRDSL